jgi:translation initiation factor IF-1
VGHSERLMSKEDHINMTGKVIQVLPNARFKVKLNDNGHTLLAYVGGKMRKFEIKIIMGDEVQVEISPYDLTQGRIIRRN